MASPEKRPKCRYNFVAFTWRIYFHDFNTHLENNQQTSVSIQQTLVILQAVAVVRMESWERRDIPASMIKLVLGRGDKLETFDLFFPTPKTLKGLLTTNQNDNFLRKKKRSPRMAP